MRLSEVLERFENQSPISVMARATLSHVFDNKRLNDLFARHAVQQKIGELAFSTVADLMGLIAIKAKPSVNAAFTHRTKEKIGVAVNSIYNKLKGIEPAVGRAMVQETANDLLKVLKSLNKGLPSPVINGFKTRIIDGNHFAGTEHRIKELRTLGAAALPGQCIPILDPDYRLMLDMIPCEDGHSSECTMIPAILELMRPGEVWIGDRKYGIKSMMFKAAQQSHFIFRQHIGSVPTWKTLGRKNKLGKVEGGVLYEQDVEIELRGQTLKLRRVSVKLDKPTRKGDVVVNLFTNLPKRISAKKIASAYRQRWKIETAFQQMAETLNCEIETLGYPKAALFSFSMGLMMFNVLSVIKTAIAAGKDEPGLAEEISTYYVALEISETWAGFRIALTDEEFARLQGQPTAAQLAARLRSLGKRVNMKQVRKNKRGPKKPPPKRKSGNRGNHVATAKILAESRT